MSNLQEFLRCAQSELEEQRFQRDYDAGLISVEQLQSRVRFIGNPKSPLAIPYHFRTDQQWHDYYGNREFDFDTKPEAPPPINGPTPPAP